MSTIALRASGLRRGDVSQGQARALYGTACRRCPLQSQCTNGKQRLIERTRAPELKQGLQRVMEQPKAALRYRQRKAMVEPIFAALRDRRGLRRSFLRRLLRLMSLFGAI